MDVITKRVQTIYPRCRSYQRALLISFCASTQNHACEVLAYQLGSKTSREMCHTLKLPLRDMSMTLEEFSKLVGRSSIISNSPAVRRVLSHNVFVQEVMNKIERALVVTMQSQTAKSIWSMDSVKALVVFSTLLDMNAVIIEKLFGEICRSDVRRLNEVNDDVQNNVSHSDDHLNALNALVGAFSSSFSTG